MGIKRLKIEVYFFITYVAILLITVSGNAYGNQKDRPNLIILLLDCVRADHLGCYGYHRETSPHIDALAAQGVKFNKAISQSPWTLPSVVSLLTGYYPHRHGVGTTGKEGRDLKHDCKNIKVLDMSIPLLPELLRQNGYQTWGFSTNPYITLSKYLFKLLHCNSSPHRKGAK